jgi:hypothetical protein
MEEYLPIRFYFGLKAAALLTSPGKRLAIAAVHPAEGVTPRIVSPVERRLDCSARHPSPIQQIKGASHDRTLHGTIPRLPAWIPQWKVRENEAGDTALLNDVPRGAHDCCGNSTRLQMPCDQTHGLVANRSKSREKNGVNAILTAPFKDLGGMVL